MSSIAAASLPLIGRRREAALRSRAVKGDPTAFGALYQRHHQELYRYCRSILAHDEDARDALQNAITRAFAALQREERDFDLRPWLFRIAHNEAITLLRQRREVRGLDAVAERAGRSLEETVSERAALAQLRADLADLPERQRAALVLRELSGLSHAEIAAVLDSTPRAIKQVIFEARSALDELREGREMDCDAVCRALSDRDGRILRGRRMRAHLRSCASCEAFGTALGRRPAQLAALAPPLPLAGGAAALAQLIGGSHATATTTAAGAGTTTLGGAAATGGMLAATGAKVVTVAALAGLVGGGVAVRPHLVAGERPHDAARHQQHQQQRARPVTAAPAGSAPQSSTTTRAPSAGATSGRASTTAAPAAKARTGPSPAPSPPARDAGAQTTPASGSSTGRRAMASAPAAGRAQAPGQVRRTAVARRDGAGAAQPGKPSSPGRSAAKPTPAKQQAAPEAAAKGPSKGAAKHDAAAAKPAPAAASPSASPDAGASPAPAAAAHQPPAARAHGKRDSASTP